MPSHGNGAFIDYGGSVRVASMVIQPGDLLAGDLHGVIFIPPEIPLFELAAAAEKIDLVESEIFALCHSLNFSLEAYEKLNTSIADRWPNHTSKEGLNLIR